MGTNEQTLAYSDEMQAVYLQNWPREKHSSYEWREGSFIFLMRKHCVSVRMEVEKKRGVLTDLGLCATCSGSSMETAYIIYFFLLWN